MQTVTLLSTVFALLLLPLRVSPYAESETLRYTVRADSFEVELTRADRTKVTTAPTAGVDILLFPRRKRLAGA